MGSTRSVSCRIAKSGPELLHNGHERGNQRCDARYNRRSGSKLLTGAATFGHAREIEARHGSHVLGAKRGTSGRGREAIRKGGRQNSVSLIHGEDVGRLGFGMQGNQGADLVCSVQLRWHESRAMTCLSLDVGGRGPKSWSRGHLGKMASPVTSSCAPKSYLRAAYSGGKPPVGSGTRTSSELGWGYRGPCRSF